MYNRNIPTRAISSSINIFSRIRHIRTTTKCKYNWDWSKLMKIHVDGFTFYYVFKDKKENIASRRIQESGNDNTQHKGL